MSTTVAIPAEIVGDMETIRGRWHSGRETLAIVARCVGDKLARDEGVGRYFTERLIDLAARDRWLHGEYDRRLAANRMARAIQPDGGSWR